MDRRSWLWRRKSSDKSPGETESSGSVSSHSERFSHEEQEPVRVSSVTASPNHAQSPEVSSKITSYDPNEMIKSLHEKLSASLLRNSANEDMVQQHAKVADEAVSGWEKAEADVAALKKQLEVTLQKNSALEDRTNHLDGALKECVRQLRQSRNEQEQTVHVALMKKTKEWENEKFELETQIIELQAKLEVNAETVSSTDHQLRLKLEALEKEKSSLQIELLARMEDLHLRTLERDLSTQAAETASKQHLESIKKVAKLEGECRRLHRKSLSVNNHIKPAFSDQKPVPSSVCAESFTDSQSDSGERLVNLDNEPSCSDSWASALIAELDQIKNDKAITGNLTAASMEIDLMEDFLEMERLAALPEIGHASSGFDINNDFDISGARDGSSRAELEVVRRVMSELEQKVAKFENEKVEIEMALAEAHNHLKISCDKLIMAENKLIELQQQLSAANGSKLIFDEQVEAADAKRKELESQLESAQMKISKLNEKVSLLEGRAEEKKALSEKLESIMEDKDSMEAERMALAFQLESAQLESRKLHEKVNFLERKFDEERKFSSEYLSRCQNLEIINTKWKEVETQLIYANKEANELHNKVSTLEGKLKEEEAISVKLRANMEDVEANRKNLSTQLELANVESVKLKERMRTLEEELLDQSVLSAELEAKCQQFQSQLSSDHLEIGQLYEKVTSLERIIHEERASSAEYKTQAEASMEAKRQVFESQINSAQLELEELRKKASLLKNNVEYETSIFARLAVDLERNLLASRIELETQLESAHSEVKRLQDNVSSLHEEVDKERSKSKELAAKCRNLEDELSRKKQDDQVQGSMTSDGVLKLKKDKDLVMTAETFAACQKTINSLSQQLKSLGNFENLLVEPENVDCDMDSLDLAGMGAKILQNSSEFCGGSSAALLNGEESGSLLSSNEY